MMLSFLLSNLYNSFLCMCEKNGTIAQFHEGNLKNHTNSNLGSLPLMQASCVPHGRWS